MRPASRWSNDRLNDPARVGPVPARAATGRNAWPFRETTENGTNVDEVE